MTRGYQMRRTARRVHRYGFQPMMFMSPGDRLPETAVVVFAHWAWRYRSEFAPATTATALWLAAWLLHLFHPHWWPYATALAAAIALGLAAVGRHVGLSTRAERFYAATTAAVAGGWLVIGIAVGPWHSPLPMALLLGGTILAVPWWAHRRRRAKVRVERVLAAWPEIADAVGLAGSRVQSAVVDVWGWRARFALARGQTINDVISRLPAIESGLGTFRGAARVLPTSDDLANRFELRVLAKDPHADAIAWPGPSVESITDPIDLGPFEDAAPVKVLFLRRHALFGGATGSGKSGGLNVLLGNLTACRDVVIWGIDLKRGVELGPWASCLDRLATTPSEARALLADAVAVLEGRADHLAATGQRVWQPTPTLPALVVVVDEYAELAENVPDAASDADSIGRRGRAVALTLIAATQRPTQKAMGQGALRSQMDVRICFRVRERRDVDLILGQGMLTAGWHADKLNAPGKFLISAPEHDTPRRARAYLLTDEAVSETAAAHAGLRPSLDEISLCALSERPQGRSASASGHGSPELDADTGDSPDALLWAALSLAPDEGLPVADLVAGTGMSHRWVNYRLRALAEAGRAIQVRRGVWRAQDPEGDGH
ncbi:MAG TPA: FtsK/SpoIIIE domain-containing protein [Streptosporangiaceae bacterium]|nr:FtsK/SpoIIIE domain-containing protein [Streptosporangiaceae bacterium]